MQVFQGRYKYYKHCSALPSMKYEEMKKQLNWKKRDKKGTDTEKGHQFVQEKHV